MVCGGWVDGRGSLAGVWLGLCVVGWFVVCVVGWDSSWCVWLVGLWLVPRLGWCGVRLMGGWLGGRGGVWWCVCGVAGVWWLVGVGDGEGGGVA